VLETIQTFLAQPIGVWHAVTAAILALLIVWRDRNANTNMRIALEAKEEQIQRIALECAAYRSVALKGKLPDKTIERLDEVYKDAERRKARTKRTRN